MNHFSNQFSHITCSTEVIETWMAGTRSGMIKGEYLPMYEIMRHNQTIARGGKIMYTKKIERSS